MDNKQAKKIDDIVALLKEIDEHNEMIISNDENVYLRDQFINNRSGYIAELKKKLKQDFNIE